MKVQFWVKPILSYHSQLSVMAVSGKPYLVQGRVFAFGGEVPLEPKSDFWPRLMVI